jgi:hypothetical protein
LPPEGVHLTVEEVADVMRATRATRDGTDPLSPNRAHADTIALTLVRALRRLEGTD